MARLPIKVGGNTLYPVLGGLLNDQLIYRPEYGGGSLLDDGKDFQDVRANFAGGLLNGAQYNPATNKFEPIAPSGLFTGIPPEDGSMVEEEGGDGYFTLPELMQFETSLRQANFGNQDPISAFSGFEDAGGGTFNIRAGSPLSSYLTGFDVDGNSVPLNEAVYQEGAKKGEKFSRRLITGRINAALSGIDESGGSDGPDGPDADGPGF